MHCYSFYADVQMQFPSFLSTIKKLLCKINESPGRIIDRIALPQIRFDKIFALLSLKDAGNKSFHPVWFEQKEKDKGRF